MCLVPLPERRCIDLDNRAFGEGIGSDELVVGRVVGDRDDADFAGDTFGAPAEVPRVKAEGAVFVVTAADADDVDAFGTDTGVGRLATFLEGSDLQTSENDLGSGPERKWENIPLFAVVCALCSCF